MKLEWIGHACFRLTAADGTVAVTDPYDAKTGYEMTPLAADLVTMSHGHADHCDASRLTGRPVVVRDLEEARVGGIVTRAWASYHDDAQGAKRGPNAIRLFEIDGLRVVHMGDQGCMPDARALAGIAGADVMMIPCGGFFTVDAAGAKAIVDAARPRLVIPMHVRLRRGGYDVLSGPEPFMALMGAADARPVRALTLLPGDVPAGACLMAPLAGEL